MNKRYRWLLVITKSCGYPTTKRLASRKFIQELNIFDSRQKCRDIVKNINAGTGYYTYSCYDYDKYDVGENGVVFKRKVVKNDNS